MAIQEPPFHEKFKLGVFSNTRPPAEVTLKFINEEEVIEKLQKCLFNLKIKPDPGNYNFSLLLYFNLEILNDHRIFTLMTEGLDEQQKDWLKDRRQSIIDNLESKVSKPFIFLEGKQNALK